jgi:hypothetical protein
MRHFVHALQPDATSDYQPQTDRKTRKQTCCAPSGNVFYERPIEMTEFNVMGRRFAWWWTRIAWIIGMLVAALLILLFSSAPAG